MAEEKDREEDNPTGSGEIPPEGSELKTEEDLTPPAAEKVSEPPVFDEVVLPTPIDLEISNPDSAEKTPESAGEPGPKKSKKSANKSRSQSPPDQERFISAIREHFLPAKQLPPKAMPVVAVHSRPLFPHMMVPLVLEGKPLLRAVAASKRKHNNYLAILCTKENYNPESNTFDMYETFGVVGRILKDYKHGVNGVQALVEIQYRIQLEKPLQERPFLIGEFEVIEEGKIVITDEIRAFCREILSSMKELVKLNQLIKEELSQFIQQINIEDPSRLADFAASLTSAEKEELQAVLTELDLMERLKKTLFLIKRELELSRLQARISKQIEERITQHQREFFLKEQLKEIRKELGLSKDDKTPEIDKFQARAKKLKFNPEAQEAFDEEIEKFSYLEPQSPEFTLCRNYLDWLSCLPWGVYQKEKLSLDRAEKILNKHQFGLREIKDRILEFIATFILKKEVSGTILCLIGPPGVGKTSVGKSIALALNRPFYRFSVGGMRDEAEIKGHRRTYIGAMPGKLIQAMKTTGKSNPVIMLDEVDKIGQSQWGDPASALLETLDPEQNSSFRDHYLDVPFDLSKVIFIATANQPDSIPAPLLDRMDVMRIAGYITKEKVEIAKKFLVPKQRENHGLKSAQLRFTEPGLTAIIEGYAREAGVRSLEKQIKKICRKSAMKIAREESAKIVVKDSNLEEFLKKPTFSNDEILGLGKPGCVVGLAWTSMGGDILTLEAEKMLSDSKGFKQSGQLGDVMKESSEIAYSFVLSNAENFGGTPEFFKKHFVHLHVPAGATPKDGPSAGAAMATALISLMNASPVKEYTAMTGELTLKGDILPIGGLKEKVIAARRARIKTVILPKENEKDFDELPDYLKDGIDFHFPSKFSQIAEVVFPKN